MDWSFVTVLEDALPGCRFQGSNMAQRILATGLEAAEDIAMLLREASE